MSDLDVLRVKFTHSNTVRERKPYTIYEIEVRSSSTITWVIYKRYTAFYALHQQLLKACMALPPAQQPQLPALPPKRLTRSLAVEFVEKRKAELQEYLRALLDTPGLLPSPILLSFLEVPDSVRGLVFAASVQRGGGVLGGTAAYGDGRGGGAGGDGQGLLDRDSKEGGGGAGGVGGVAGKSAYQHKTFEERRTLELVNALKHASNKVSAISSYELYYFEHKPRLSPELIRVLFAGKANQEGEGGLIVTCGDVHYSHVAARAALHLLLRFVDVERNKDAQYFLDVLLSLDLSLLKRLQLHQHIISERGNRLTAFRLLHCYRSALVAHRSSVMGGGVSVDHSIQALIGDGWAVKEFYRWSERRVEGVVLGKGREGGDGEEEDSVPNLSDVSGRSVIQQSMLDVMQLYRDDDGWREARMCEGVGEIEAADVRLEYKRLSGAAATAGSGGIGGGGSAGSSKEGSIVLRLQSVLGWSAEQVAAVVSDLSKRKEWDVKYHTHQVMGRVALREEDDERAESGVEAEAAADGGGDVEDEAEQGILLHYTYKSFASPYKYRDLLLLTATCREDGADRARPLLSPTADSLASPSSSAMSPSHTASSSFSILSPSASPAPLMSPLSPSLPGPAPAAPPTPLASPTMGSSAASSSSSSAGPLLVHLLRSVVHSSLPDSKHRRRPAFHSSGFLFHPLSASSCLFTLLLCCDKESVLIVSADLLGESVELRESCARLRRLLADTYGDSGGSGGGGGSSSSHGAAENVAANQRVSSVLHHAINGREAEDSAAGSATLTIHPPVMHASARVQ